MPVGLFLLLRWNTCRFIARLDGGLAPQNLQVLQDLNIPLPPNFQVTDLVRCTKSLLGYVHDRVLPGMLHARMLRPPRPYGKLVSLPSAPAGVNTAADELLGFSRLPDADRNTLISVLTNSATRRLFGAGWADEARRMVTQFRATHDLWAGDPAFRDLLARLRAGCPEFDGWWGAHDVSGVVAGRKSLNHPKKGRLRFEYASFQANDDPGLKLVIYGPA